LIVAGPIRYVADTVSLGPLPLITFVVSGLAGQGGSKLQPSGRNAT
jgi:hypothetical protein